MSVTFIYCSCVHKGTLTWATGEKYVGQYKDNKKCGLGKATKPNGTVIHDGEWVADQPKK